MSANTEELLVVAPIVITIRTSFEASVFACVLACTVRSGIAQRPLSRSELFGIFTFVGVVTGAIVPLLAVLIVEVTLQSASVVVRDTERLILKGVTLVLSSITAAALGTSTLYFVGDRKQKMEQLDVLSVGTNENVATRSLLTVVKLIFACIGLRESLEMVAFLIDVGGIVL